MPKKLTDLEKAEKAVDAAFVTVGEATSALREAEAARDMLIEQQAESDSTTLAHNVQAYQESQKQYRASRLAKRQEVQRLLNEAI